MQRVIRKDINCIARRLYDQWRHANAELSDLHIVAQSPRNTELTLRPIFALLRDHQIAFISQRTMTAWLSNIPWKALSEISGSSSQNRDAEIVVTNLRDIIVRFSASRADALLSPKLIFRTEHLGDLLGSTLQAQGNHRRSRNHWRPAITVVSTNINDDISLTELAGDKIDQLICRSQFLGHSNAFRKIEASPSKPRRRKRSSYAAPETCLQMSYLRGKIF